MGEHFEWTFDEDSGAFESKRKHDSVRDEERLNGICVIRTSLEEELLGDAETVRAWRALPRRRTGFARSPLRSGGSKARARPSTEGGVSEYPYMENPDGSPMGGVPASGHPAPGRSPHQSALAGLGLGGRMSRKLLALARRR